MTDQHSDPSDPTTVDPGAGDPTPTPRDRAAADAARAAPPVSRGARHAGRPGDRRRRPRRARPPLDRGGRPRRRRARRGRRAAVVLALTGAAPPATVLGYVPAGQRRRTARSGWTSPATSASKVAEFLSHFPGFADQAALETKLNEVLDQLVRKASTASRPTRQGHQAVVRRRARRSASATAARRRGAADGRRRRRQTRAPCCSCSVKDPAAAQAWFDKLLDQERRDDDRDRTHGTTMTTSREAGRRPSRHGDHRRQGRRRSATSLGQGGHRHQGRRRASRNEPGPKAALAAANQRPPRLRLHGPRPALRLVGLAAESMQRPCRAPRGLAGSCAVDRWTVAGLLPDWVAFTRPRRERRARHRERRAAAAEARRPRRPTTPRPRRAHPGQRDRAGRSTNDSGATLKQALDLYKSQPRFKDAIDQLDQALGLTRWPDAPSAGSATPRSSSTTAGDGAEAGIIVDARPTRPRPTQLFTSSSLVSLGGAQQGITRPRRGPTTGPTITIVDLGSIEQARRLAGASRTDVPGRPLPERRRRDRLRRQRTTSSSSAAARASSSTSSTPTTASRSPTTDRYKSLVGRVGDGTGVTFVDITRDPRPHREAHARRTTRPRDQAEYETDVKPFLAPFDALRRVGLDQRATSTTPTSIITVK